MIDITKQYKTRDGRDVRILCVDGPSIHHPVIGIISGETIPTRWSEHGIAAFPCCDLLEVKPKIVVERWVNIFQYKNYSSSGPHIDWFDDSQSAFAEHYNPNITVLARAVPFKWEGEG